MFSECFDSQTRTRTHRYTYRTFGEGGGKFRGTNFHDGANQ